ncbi:phage tail protein [Ferribacterium limneticum]|uniref:phage tail protein n=1 Tax=Ferribacterium limneticum TaxID=76259 RepID=UPI001CF830F4|nr:phage tail protein [Ferribacterium limneticum]UCV26804.1 phage tail protein [Ferribacterium limneticum]UCV30721.1 phage tail protein [Ferribacterium limneticum]
MSGTFVWIPDHGAEEDISTSVLSAKFGDGYEQRAEDGINSVRSRWNLVFSKRTLADVNAMSAFLRLKKGAEPFDWAPPGETARKFKCVGWRRVLSTDTDCSLSCTLEEVFDL